MLDQKLQTVILEQNSGFTWQVATKGKGRNDGVVLAEGYRAQSRAAASAIAKAAREAIEKRAKDFPDGMGEE